MNAFPSDIRGRDEKFLMPLSERVECKGMIIIAARDRERGRDGEREERTYHLLTYSLNPHSKQIK